MTVACSEILYKIYDIQKKKIQNIVVNVRLWGGMRVQRAMKRTELFDQSPHSEALYHSLAVTVV